MRLEGKVLKYIQPVVESGKEKIFGNGGYNRRNMLVQPLTYIRSVRIQAWIAAILIEVFVISSVPPGYPRT
jgi:hypothetical protein